MTSEKTWFAFQTALLGFLSAVLVLVIFGTIATALGYSETSQMAPCPLCYLQRVAMFMIAIAGVMNLRTGNRPGNHALMLIGALFGSAVSLRQITLHICPEFPTYPAVFLGIGLYTWAFLVFIGTILYVILNLALLDWMGVDPRPIRNRWIFTLEILFGLLLLGNVIEVLWQCGLGPCHDV